MAPTRAIRRRVASDSGEDFSQAIAAVDSSSESSDDAGADGGPDNSGSDGGSGSNNSDGSGSGAGDDASRSEADKDGSGSSSRGSVGAAGPALPMPVGPAGPALPMPVGPAGPALPMPVRRFRRPNEFAQRTMYYRALHFLAVGSLAPSVGTIGRQADINFFFGRHSVPAENPSDGWTEVRICGVCE